VAVPTRGPARTLLSGATFAQTMCVIGACLAEALKYAHERGLVHLDLKPANVLLAADGQPMLLDFHLARAPLKPGGASPGWFGGPPKYRPPGQRQAPAAVKARRIDFPAVDGRSDIYSLGLVLYEALGGEIPFDPQAEFPRLERRNAQVTTGLADIIHKCLAADPARRYADAGALATDLNCYLADRPLRGVGNRSLAERWRKWKRRRPAGRAGAAGHGRRHPHRPAHGRQPGARPDGPAPPVGRGGPGDGRRAAPPAPVPRGAAHAGPGAKRGRRAVVGRPGPRRAPARP